MSQNFKTAVKYWFWLIVGIALISIQVYKYWINTLNYDWKEASTLFIGMMLMIKPTALPDFLLKVFRKK